MSLWEGSIQKSIRDFDEKSSLDGELILKQISVLRVTSTAVWDFFVCIHCKQNTTHSDFIMTMESFIILP